MKSLIDRGECPMRHENGNCTVAGGFCTAVNDPICEALHNAFHCGESAEMERTVLMMADINVKYAQRNLKVLKQIHEKVTSPAADGVNLVYCKNCKYHDKNDNHCIHPNNAVEEQVPEIGKYYRIRVTPKVEEDHFCGYGRKREDA